MDELGAFFDGPRARRAFTLRALLAAPWSIEVRDEAPLAVVVVAAGGAWLRVGTGDEIPLHPGDVALVRGPHGYAVADTPGAPATVIVLPGQQCVSPAGESLSAAMTLGVNTWGNSPVGETCLLVGAYHGDGELGQRLTDALPEVAILRAGEWDDAVVALLTAELPSTALARDVVLDRLLDVLVVTAARAWFARPDADRPTWAAYDDPLVAQAVAAMQDAPERPWTVDSLARSVGLSRAAFARRFHVSVGEPPMTYLTRWRMALAADLLRESGASVTSVANAVGYATPFAFSTAFKRHYGRSPRGYLRPTG
ncbi:MAG: AraC family transcriptional regulator [Phycicoccus sp.]|nr:AraC family transcriptional regulator [Phycicoccus sp.]